MWPFRPHPAEMKACLSREQPLGPCPRRGARVAGRPVPWACRQLSASGGQVCGDGFQLDRNGTRSSVSSAGVSREARRLTRALPKQMRRLHWQIRCSAPAASDVALLPRFRFHPEQARPAAPAVAGPFPHALVHRFRRRRHNPGFSLWHRPAADGAGAAGTMARPAERWERLVRPLFRRDSPAVPACVAAERPAHPVAARVG